MQPNAFVLTGFLGTDAELSRTDEGDPLVALFLATGNLLGEAGEYTSRTDGHRLLVAGQLTDFASTLKKGAHLQVEARLQSRTFNDMRTGGERVVWENWVRAILELDCAEEEAVDDRDVHQLRHEI